MFPQVEWWKIDSCCFIWQILGSLYVFLHLPITRKWTVAAFHAFAVGSQQSPFESSGWCLWMFHHEVVHWPHLQQYVKINFMVFCQGRNLTICPQIKWNELGNLWQGVYLILQSLWIQDSLNENRIIHANMIEFNLFLFIKKNLKRGGLPSLYASKFTLNIFSAQSQVLIRNALNVN